MESKTVYQTDAKGFYLHEATAYELQLQPGVFNVPYGAKETAPPAAPAGQIQWWGESGWSIVADHREDRLYVRSSGAAYQIGSVIEVDNESVTYDGGGDIPAWLTDIPPAIEGGGAGS